MSRPTAKKIADMLNISPTAVSLALNNKPGVSERTKAAVIQAAMDIGYALPNLANERYVHNHKIIVFLIVFGETMNTSDYSLFATMVLQGLETAAAAKGYSVVVRNTTAEDLSTLSTFNVMQNASAVVLLAADVTAERQQYVSEFIQEHQKIPTVVLDNPMFSGEAHCVCDNNAVSVYKAVNHLFDLGHESVGYFRSLYRIVPFKEREEGLMNALNQRHCPLTACVNVDLNYTTCYQEITSWLQTKPKLPHCFFADNDAIAAAAIRAFTDMNIVVPRDVSIIGFNDLPIAEISSPRLSTLKAFFPQRGDIAFNMILGQLNQQSQGSTLYPLSFIRLSNTLIHRESIRNRKIPLI